MTDDMRLLLRILLEQELREAEPEMQRPRKKREAEREDGIDYAPAESREKTKRTKDTMKEERAEDLQQGRSDMYSTHENVAYNMKKVPIWEKYALSLSEAAEYFHIGTKKTSTDHCKGQVCQVSDLERRTGILQTKNV